MFQNVWDWWLGTEWAPYCAYRDVELDDGTKANGWVMRRRDAGKWVYRQCTTEEADDAYAWWATR